MRVPAKAIGRYLPLVVWLGFIFFASTDEFSASNTSRIIEPLVLWLFPNTSAETLALVHFLTRKAAHFTEYFILGLFAARAFYPSTNQFLSRRWLLVSLLLVGFYALADEYHQSFVPSRTSSVFDSMIDISGGLTALLLFHWYKRRSQYR
jgi:VanZ family protein